MVYQISTKLLKILFLMNGKKVCNIQLFEWAVKHLNMIGVSDTKQMVHYKLTIIIIINSDSTFKLWLGCLNIC